MAAPPSSFHPPARPTMDGARNIKRQDTTRGPSLRILSLDGGGVRGYSMLIILQELMHQTYVEAHGRPPRYDQLPKPCDYFDLIAGTGTGGLIAIMLGRLRLDLQTCKDVYVRMTRKVFVSDKRVAGIPYSDTLFKASELQEAIMECVREHTTKEGEGYDGSSAVPPRPDSFASPNPSCPFTPGSFDGLRSPTDDKLRRSFTNSSSSAEMARQASQVHRRSSGGRSHRGNPNALLYDARENRTKTAVTAVYQGSTKDIPPAILRSYDSRKEPAPEANCAIWEAGRATCAIGLAFKPIRIGQSIFTDEGEGRFNPCPLVVDEALINEWPGRQIGVIVSIGTGRRKGNVEDMPHQWWEGILGGGMQDFVEARRRLTMKIQGCEVTHQYMLAEHLRMRGIDPESYIRLNVDEGVGDYGMNEWDRLPNVTTSTRSYLGKYETKALIANASTRLGSIKRRQIEKQSQEAAAEIDSVNLDTTGNPMPDPMYGGAVELPGSSGMIPEERLPDGRPIPGPPPGRPVGEGPYHVPTLPDRPTSSHHSPPPRPGYDPHHPPAPPSPPLPPRRTSVENLLSPVSPISPLQPIHPSQPSQPQPQPISAVAGPPPLPPKMPLPPPPDDSLTVQHPSPAQAPMSHVTRPPAPPIVVSNESRRRQSNGQQVPPPPPPPPGVPGAQGGLVGAQQYPAMATPPLAGMPPPQAYPSGGYQNQGMGTGYLGPSTGHQSYPAAGPQHSQYQYSRPPPPIQPANHHRHGPEPTGSGYGQGQAQQGPGQARPRPPYPIDDGPPPTVPYNTKPRGILKNSPNRVRAGSGTAGGAPGGQGSQGSQGRRSGERDRQGSFP